MVWKTTQIHHLHLSTLWALGEGVNSQISLHHVLVFSNIKGGPKNLTATVATVAFEVVRVHQEKPRKFVGVMGQYFYLFLEVDLKVNHITLRYNS